jgi:hypothetical protein
MDHWDYSSIKDLDPAMTLGGLAAFGIIFENQEKSPFIEFAMRISAGNCRGTRKPSALAIQKILKATGNDFFTRMSREHGSGLQDAFMSQSFFLRGIEGSVNQSIDAAWKRFHAHDLVLRERAGFTVGNAIFFSRTLVNMIHSRTLKVPDVKPVRVNQRQFHDFGFFVRPERSIMDAWPPAIRFKMDDLSRAVPTAIRGRVRPFLDSVSLPLNDFPQNPSWSDDSPLHDRPIVRINGEYLLLIFANLFRGLSNRLHRVLIDDPRYWGTYGHSKGRVLEEWAADALRRALPSAQIFRNLKYSSRGREGEADIVLCIGEYALFAECTTKWIQPDSRRGVADAINYDLANSVGKCYRQARAAKLAFLAGDLALPAVQRPSKLIPVIVTDVLYPNLLLDVSWSHEKGSPLNGQYLKSLVEEGDYPYIVCIFDIEGLTAMADERTLVQFFAERIELSKLGTIISYDEPDYLRFYVKPDYEAFKSMLTRTNSVLNYVGSPELPARKSSLYLGILDAIGSETFAIADLRGSIGREAKRIAMETLYSVYCDWDEAGTHLVHDETEFWPLTESHHKQGKPCKLIAWEGFWDYVRGPKSPQQILRRIERRASKMGLRALLLYGYDLGPDILRKEQIQESEEDLSRFLQRQDIIKTSN